MPTTPAHRPEPGEADAIPASRRTVEPLDSLAAGQPLSAGWIRSYAGLWALGLAHIWWPALLFRALRHRRPGVAPSVWPSVVLGSLAVSLLVAAVTGAPMGRLVGAGYNLAVWATLVALTVVRLDAGAICRGVAQLAGVQSVAVLVALGVYPVLSGVPLPSTFVLPPAVTRDPAFESFSTVRLVMEDYFGEVVLRAGGFFGNATWSGALSALGMLVTLPLLRAASTSRRVLYGALLALDAVALYLSYSRNTWIALACALLAMAIAVLRRRRQWLSLALLGTACCGIGVYVATSVDLGAALARFNSVREGSYGSRTAIYTATWAAIQKFPFPVLGNGVKDRMPGLVASLGTHSSYLGLLYRGGWLAAIAFLAWLVVLGWRAMREGVPLALGATVFAAVWAVAEDLDVGHLAPLALVVALAALVREGRADDVINFRAPVGPVPA